MRTMSAVRLTEWGRGPELVEIDVPEPGPGQVRVKVAGCGLCHSDLTMAAMPSQIGEALGWDMPFTLGHETAGWVDAWGPGVTGWSEGEAVALAALASCGSCRRCRAGRENACSHSLVGRGYGSDGGLAEFVVVQDPGRSLVRLGDLDPRTAGPLTDAAATAHHGVSRIAPRVSGDGAVVIVGAGGLGLFGVQLAARLTSAIVVAIDPDPVRRELARSRGAALVVDGVDRDTRSTVHEVLGRVEVDAVVDFVGTDDTIDLGTTLVSPGGAFALVGASGGTLRKPWYGGLPRDAEVFTYQGSDLADLRAVIELSRAGDVVVDVEPFALRGALDAYAALEQGGLSGRVVVQPDEV